jgi:hypothetical protein
MSGAPALLSPLGGSRFLVGGICERRPDTQIALSVRLGTDQAVAKCFGSLAGPELADDLPCATVDDDECLQGADSGGETTRLPTFDANREGRVNVGSTPTKERVVVSPEDDGSASSRDV